MVTPEQQNEIYLYTVGLFKAAPGAYYEGLVGFVESGYSTQDMALALANSPVFNGLYNTDSDDAFVSAFLNNLVGDTLDAATMQAAVAGMNSLVADQGRAQAAVAIIDLLADQSPSDPTFGEARQLLQGRVDAAKGYQAFPGAKGLSANIATLQNVVEATDTAQYLTDGIDNLLGGIGNDLFQAYIYDNSNSLESGDIINGGAGTDVLRAEVGSSQDFAISAKTVSVENMFFTAQNLAWDNADNTIGDRLGFDTTIDAGEFAGVRQLWSDDSRASLVIEDVSEDSHLTTIGMRDTDSAVNYEVYFDQQNVTDIGSQESGGSLILTIADLDRMDQGLSPLSDAFPYDILTVHFEGVSYELDIDYTDVEDHDDLVAAINDALAADGVTQFEAVKQGSVNVVHPDTSNPLVVDQVVIQKVDATMEGNFDAAMSTWDNSGIIPGDTAYLTRVQDEQAVAQPSLTQVDVVVDNVGRGCVGGDLVIGAMAECLGIEQFNVQVDRNSWLSTLRSNNELSHGALEVVNVVNISENDAEGNGNLRIDALNDVRVFDASEMAGNVTLTATLSNEIVAKYFSLTDSHQDNTQDDSDPVDYLDVVDTYFSYDFGAGSDSLNLTLSADNFQDAGSAAFEDFQLEVNGNDGNDRLTVRFDDATANDADFWYFNQSVNQANNSSIVINGGAGNDTISTPGAGNMTINAGSGNDVVFSDNTGAKAQWVINAANLDLNDLDGNGPGATGLLYGAQLTLTFAAANLTLPAGMTQPNADAYDVGFESTVRVTTNDLGNQATVNQAIKNAINNDAVLSKLLLAEDGPENTLVITSKIDGQFSSNDIVIDVEAIDLADQSTATQDDLQDAYELLMRDSDAVLTQAILDGYANAYDGNIATLALQGSDSVYTSDNRINVGSGDDLVVLGTGANSNDTLVFTGTDLGKVTVVNFDDAVGSASMDSLNFGSYLIGKTSASESVSSERGIADTYDFLNVSGVGGTAGADEIIVINDFAAVAGETWATMTASDFLTAIQDETGTEIGYGNIDSNDIDVAAAPANYVGDTMHHVFMVENDLNAGEYKAFYVTSEIDADGNEFNSASLISIIDFGASFDLADDGGVVPGPVQVDVTVADLQTYDASTDDFNFILDFAAAGAKFANINGFDDGDTVTLLNAPAGSAVDFASSAADSIEFAAGDLVAFTNAWAITVGAQDPVEVADFVAAADEFAATQAIWGDWLVA